jgi:hypothetical protein
MLFRRSRDLVRRRLGTGALICALILLGAAAWLIVDGMIIFGAIASLVGVGGTWLVGLWVVPRSGDAYAKRITQLLPGSFANVRKATGQQLDRLRHITAALAERRPPFEYADLHARIVEILAEIDGLDRTDPTLLVQNTNRVVALRQELADLRNELDTHSDEPYVRMLVDTLDRRESIASETPARVQQPLIRQKETLDQLTVPQSWRVVHNAYARQLSEYLVALAGYYAAGEGGDREDAEAAALALEVQQSKLGGLIDLYGSALRSYYAGHPAGEPSKLVRQLLDLGYTVE